MLLVLLGLLGTAVAGGPRYVTGRPFFNTEGQAIGWKQSTLLYSTDAGDLSANVNHAAADALVAQAAAVWNVSVASITVAQGAGLAEHVSSQNVYMDANGMHYPADVSAQNAANVPIAVIYDADGSVTDTLLGSGASSPSSCRQNAVTESVDSFDPAGYILHAVMIVNGRCTGTAPAAQQQLRYQMMRVFGRVLGLAWSQTNDNVFTGTPAPTSIQAKNWPIMHPVDIVCGLYTYQCLPNPFTLRPDDIGAMVSVYPIDGSQGVPAGKQLSFADAQSLSGFLRFPNGLNMAGVNVLVRREPYSTTVVDGFFVASGVSGAYGARGRTSALATPGTDAMSSQGNSDTAAQGYYVVPWFPMTPSGAAVDNRLTSTEPVNPLYAGEYTLGPYPAGDVTPSGSALATRIFVVGRGRSSLDYTPTDAVVTCASGTDGVFYNFAATPPSGWWQDRLCGYGHMSYRSANMRPNRTFTVEVTALDESGAATTTKAMPVMGLFGPNDNPYTDRPSLTTQLTAFNGLTLGTTALHASTGNASSIRLGIADQRGDGRPDFAYQARLFYADDLAPAQVAASGGTITITGTGFRAGNTVLVNGVAAQVVSWTANTVVANVPNAVNAQATISPVDVTVLDRTTGASTTLTGALTYSITASSQSMRLVSAPSGSLMVGDVAAIPFQVQMVGSDGTTPVANVAVTLDVPSNAATYAACGGAARCTLRSDANGMVTSTVTPGAAGTTTLRATAGSLVQYGSFNGVAQVSSLVATSTPESPLYKGISSNNAFAVQGLASNGSGMPFRAVVYSVVSGSATFDACSAAPCTVFTDYTATARTTVTPTATGTLVLQARDGDYTQTVTLQVKSGDDTMTLTQSPAPQSYMGEPLRMAVLLTRPDGSTPDVNEPVTFSGSAGVTFAECGTATCTIQSNGGGVAFLNIDVNKVGTYTVSAQYLNLSQTVTFSQVQHSLAIRILSAPANGSRVGVAAAAPLTVQVVNDDGTPAAIAGGSIILGGATGTVLVPNCNQGACEIYVGSDATASVQVIPQLAGQITLSAVFASNVVTTTFTAVGTGRSMRVVTQPVSGQTPLGTKQEVDIQVIEGDGAQPVARDRVVFSVVSGSFSYYGGQLSYDANTGSDGIAYTAGFAGAAGPIVLRADDGFASMPITFIAGTPQNVIKLVSSPASPAGTYQVAPNPFSVQVFQADGTTPAQNTAVAFTVSQGSASFSGCASATCTVVTDQYGLASISVTPRAAGPVTLLATVGYVAQQVGFNAVGSPDTLSLVSAPATGSYVGQAAGTAFSVRALQADGTAAAGRSITVSVTAGSATLGACGGSASCVLQADSTGLVTSAVTPTAAGNIGLQAVDGSATVSASFNATIRPDVMRLVSAPANGSYSGVVAGQAFTVQVLQGDGTTAAAGRSVMLSVAAGSAIFGACSGAASCTLTADANGLVSSAVTPGAAGSVTLQAADGSVTQSATFTVVDRADTMSLVSAPANSSGVGYAAAASFAVKVLHGDGTAAAGKVVTFSVTSGTARFGACAGTTCTVTTGTDGSASTAVTPLGAGTITLLASEDVLRQSASFTAVMQPDTITVQASPENGGFPGTPAATPLRLLVLLADGSTPAAGRSISLSVTAGSAGFAGCAGASSCSLTTDGSGQVSTAVTPLSVGLITLQAMDGSVTASASFTTIARPDTLTVVSAPAGAQPTNVPAATPFSVKLLHGDGTADVGETILLTSVGASFVGCTVQPCSVTTAADGTVSATVMPATVGQVTVSAMYGSLVVSATFSAYQRADTLALVSAPAGTQATGVAATPRFVVRLLTAEGLADAGKSIVFAGQNASVAGCAGAPCSAVTGADGSAGVTVTPAADGAVTVSATYGSLTQTVSFNAATAPGTLALVSAPAGSQPVGVVASPAFAVRLLMADGSAESGRQIVFTAAGASVAGCTGSPCAAVTGSDGTAAVTVTPTTAGQVTLTASYNNLVQQAIFTAYNQPDTLTLVFAPGGSQPVGVAATPGFSVRLLKADGTPDGGQQVVFTANGASYAGCANLSCAVTTAADGTATLTVTPTTAGAVSLSAAFGSLMQTATFTAYQRPDTLAIVTAPAGSLPTGVTASTLFQVQLLKADGTADAGRTIQFAAAGANFPSCAAAACTVSTGVDGTAAVAVQPQIPGTVTLTVTYGSLVQTTTFTAYARSDMLTVLSGPGATYVGATSATAFAVQLLAADGTARAGVAVQVSAVGGAVMTSCGASICALVTDSTGRVSTGVRPYGAGAITLTANSEGLSVSAGFQALANQDTVTAVQTDYYLLEGATGAFTLALQATQNGVAAAGQGLSWSGSAGFQPVHPAAATDSSGQGSSTALAGPLAAGTQAQVTACAFDTPVCAQFRVTGVAAGNLSPIVTAGGGQTGAPYSPVTVTVTDAAGHAVSGAAVTVYQTVTALDVACPVRGRCPAAPVLATQVQTVSTDVSGQATFQPLTVEGVATETQIAVSAGTSGFVTTVLTRQP